MANVPVYLFSRLGRSVAVSTETGDFYDVPPAAYTLLEQWIERIGVNGTDDDVYAPGRELGLPDDILSCFPLPVESEVKPSSDEVITDITLNITSQCNLRCAYCWNEQGAYSDSAFQKGGSADTYTMQSGVMSVETAQAAVDFLLARCGDEKNLVIDFYGGEPLLNCDLIRAVVAYAKSREEERGVRFHYLLATNGTLLTPVIAEELMQIGVQIAVSIDGEKNMHDENRPFADGRGTFDTIMGHIRGMDAAAQKRLVGRVTVTPKNADMVAQYHTLTDLGFERIELFESEDACHAITPEREAFFFRSDEDRERLIAEYEKLAEVYIRDATNGTLNYAKTFFNRFFKLMQRLYYKDAIVGGCPAAKGQVAISVTGDIYPCTAFLGVEQFKLGTVRDGFDRARYAAFLDATYRRFDECRACELFALCQTTGSCLNMNHYFNDDIAKPYERGCALFKIKLELAVATLAILSEAIPDELDRLFGNDPIGRRGNELY